MLIWGSGHKDVRADITDTSVCPQCRRTNNFSVVVDYDYSHMYWLFKSIKNVSTSLVCKECGHAQALDKQRQGQLYSNLGGNPIPFMDRFGAAVLVLLVAAGIAYGYLSQAGRDDSGVVVRSGTIDAFDIRIGDCYDDSEAANGEEAVEISGVFVRPCAEPHDYEVFAVFDLELASYPGGDAVSEMAWDGCLAQFEPFVGRDYETSSLDIQWLSPTAESWSALNDREVVCAVYDLEENKLLDSMQGSGI